MGMRRRGADAPTVVAVSAPPGQPRMRVDRQPGRWRTPAVFPIQAFVGANGGGKSLAVMAMVVAPAWRQGRLVVSNMRLYPDRMGYDAGLYQPVTSWRDLAKIGRCPEDGCAAAEAAGGPCAPGECPASSTAGHGCVLVLDEASAALPSRASQSLPAQLLRVMNQLRKRDVQLVWTAPAWGRMDLAIRECTQAVTVCTGLLPDVWKRDLDPNRPAMFPPKAIGDDGQPVKVERSWAPNRLFRFDTFEALSYDEFTLGKAQKMRPRSRRSYWRTRHADQFGYVSVEQVSMLDHLADSGSCMNCGHRKKSVPCTCDDPVPGAPEGAVGARRAPRTSGRPTGRDGATGLREVSR